MSRDINKKRSLNLVSEWIPFDPVFDTKADADNFPSRSFDQIQLNQIE